MNEKVGTDRIELTHDQYWVMQDWWESTLRIAHDPELPAEIRSSVLQFIDEFPLYYCEVMDRRSAFLAARRMADLSSRRERYRRLKNG